MLNIIIISAIYIKSGTEYKLNPIIYRLRVGGKVIYRAGLLNKLNKN